MLLGFIRRDGKSDVNLELKGPRNLKKIRIFKLKSFPKALRGEPGTHCDSFWVSFGVALFFRYFGRPSWRAKIGKVRSTGPLKGDRPAGETAAFYSLTLA